MNAGRPLYRGVDGEGDPIESGAVEARLPHGRRPPWRPGAFGLRRAAAIASLGIVAILAGTLTAWKPLAALAIAGAGLVVLLGALIVHAVNLRRPVSARSDVRSFVPFLLFCYLLPMLMLSRVFSLIGRNPIYLPDVLITLTAGVALFRTRWRHLGVYAFVSGVIGLLMLHAVAVGREHQYPAATKGIVLVLYPLVALPIAAWVSQRADIERLLSVLPRVIFPLIPIGLLIVLHGEIPSAYGLEFACVGSFLVVAGVPGRKLLALSFVVGVGILIGSSAKRGVELTVCVSVAVAWFATKRSLSKRSVIVLGFGVLVAIFAITVVARIIVLPPNIPVLSDVADRASGQQVSASHNVTVRERIWAYGLETTWHEDPLLGVGAYHPIEVVYLQNNFATNFASGVHDSFVGYTFYAGYPEGLLVVFVWFWGVVRLWRVRRRSPYAPAVLGCVVAAILTAATNVSFEVTYMGGPSWLILGLAFGLSAKLMDETSPPSSLTSSSDLDVAALVS